MRHSIACVLSCLCLALSVVIVGGCNTAGGPTVRSQTVAGAQDPGALKRAKDLNSEVLQHIHEGRYREGIPKAREALALREQALGPTHPDVATSLNNLAELLRRTGDYAAAKPLHER